MSRDTLGDGWCILYLTLGMLALEGAYIQTCWAGAQLYAYYTLFRGTQAENTFLETFLLKYKWKIMVQLGLLTEWLILGILPEVRNVIGRRRWVAGVGYLMVVMGTLYGVRYSNKYFVLLEMMDVWIVGGKLGGMMGVVWMDVLRRRLRGDSPGSRNEPQ